LNKKKSQNHNDLIVSEIKIAEKETLTLQYDRIPTRLEYIGVSFSLFIKDCLNAGAV
jgi:hypothetical protein